MEQAELERVRAEKAQMCQQLADATATLDRVASSLRDLPRLQLPVGGSENLLPAPRSNSGWVAGASSSASEARGTLIATLRARERRSSLDELPAFHAPGDRTDVGGVPD
jgi:hypothetical protein